MPANAFIVLKLCINLILTLKSAPVKAYIPRPCSTNITKPTSNCCPIPKGFTQPCGYPWRGRCQQARKQQDYIVEYFKGVDSDIRINWPTRIFNSTCRCARRFGGFDCSSCALGFSGKSCLTKVHHVRRALSSLSHREQEQFVSVLNLSRHVISDYVKPYGQEIGKVKYFKDMSIHETMVSIHYIGYTYHSSKQQRDCEKVSNTNHRNFVFLLWHRYFLLFWERALSEIAYQYFGLKNFTIPYWDYTDRNQSCMNSSGLLCNPADSSCFSSNWTSFCQDQYCSNCERSEANFINRTLNATTVEVRRQRHLPLFPTSREILNALKAPYFYTKDCRGGFGSYVESGCKCLHQQSQMHNLVHDLYAGDMRDAVSSPNDPIFLFHHGQVDRLFERWILKVKPNSSYIPKYGRKNQICRSCKLVGFLPPVAPGGFIGSIRNFGVSYENLDFGSIKESIDVETSENAKAFSDFVCNIDDDTALKMKSILA